MTHDSPSTRIYHRRTATLYLPGSPPRHVCATVRRVLLTNLHTYRTRSRPRPAITKDFPLFDTTVRRQIDHTQRLLITAHEAALGYRGTLDLLQRGVHVHAECPRTNCHVVEKNIILACRGSSASDEADNMRYQRRPRLTQTCNLCAPSVSVQARRRDRGDTTAY